jgi:hypothetical protein
VNEGINRVEGALPVINHIDTSDGSADYKAVCAAMKARQLDRVKRLIHNKTKLNLVWQNIGYEDVKLLAGALAHNTSLTLLNLSLNKIGADGAKALANALLVKTSLTTLDVSNCRIGDDGAKALAGALAHNTSLTELNLNDNRIGADGMTALCDAMRWNANITDLNLNNNLDSAQCQQLKQQISAYTEVGDK